MAVKGNLKDIGLTSLISINCNEMNQARLSIMNEGKQATVFFNDGNIVHAELDSHEGEDVLFELLRWEEGDFDLEQGVQADKQTVHTPWSGILLEGMHRIDEGDAGVDAKKNAETLAFAKTGEAGKVLAAIKRVKGVNEVLLCSKEGGSASEDSDDTAGFRSIASFLVKKAVGMAEYLHQSVMNSILLYEGKDRLLIVPYEPGLLIVRLSTQASVQGILDVINQLRERYPLIADG